jgi:hypothetical protein
MTLANFYPKCRFWPLFLAELQQELQLTITSVQTARNLSKGNRHVWGLQPLAD